MPLVGPVCGFDGTNQTFEKCIGCHESMSKERNCNVPVATLKNARDNGIHRAGAGVSASTILACARETAIMERYDYYETPVSMWNKHRGTLAHLLMEGDETPPEGVIRERRLERYVVVDGERFRVSGQTDYADPNLKVIIDYKSAYNVPTKLNIRHQHQLSIYRYLLADGVFCDTGEICRVEIESGGIHYLTFNTKPDKAWKKVAYPLIPLDKIEAFIIERALPLLHWQQTQKLPECNCFDPSPYWPCGCSKLEAQLNERGVMVG